METITKQWQTKKLKTVMLRCIDKQSWESVESVLKKKRKATVNMVKYVEQD